MLVSSFQPGDGIDKTFKPNDVQKVAIEKCAIIQLKYRYKEFLSRDSKDYPEYEGVWHNTARQKVQSNIKEIEIMGSKSKKELFPKYM